MNYKKALLGQLPPKMDENRKLLALWTVFENTGAFELLNVPSVWRDPDAKFVMAVKERRAYLYYLIYHHDPRFFDVYHLIGIDNLEWVLTQVVNCEYVDAIERILADPRFTVDNALLVSSTSRDVSFVKRILADPRIDPASGDNDALIHACLNGNVKVVDLLLKDPRIDPTKQAAELVDIACETDDPVLLKRLLVDSRIRTASWNFLFSINQSHEYFRYGISSEILRIVDRFL